jgi:hypothetical protein
MVAAAARGDVAVTPTVRAGFDVAVVPSSALTVMVALPAAA